MSREIKFRAWCKYANGYVMDYDPYGDEYSCEGTPINDLFTQKSQESLNQILMQYTGLKDKNGVEIYEGDIVQKECGVGYSSKFYRSWADGTTSKKVSVVTWDAELVCFTHVQPHTDSNFITEFEIIGNIYENPKLLEKYSL